MSRETQGKETVKQKNMTLTKSRNNVKGKEMGKGVYFQKKEKGRKPDTVSDLEGKREKRRREGGTEKTRTQRQTPR